MIYQELLKQNNDDRQIYARIDDDGICRLTCTSDHLDFLRWLEEGNLPLAPEKNDNPWGAIRDRRDVLLRNSDWTMTPGASIDQSQWAVYRQILRDLPQTFFQSGPESIIWPTEPSTAGPNTDTVE